jgi:tachylectin
MTSAVLLYGIKPDGEMRWYRHDGWADGSFTWTAGDGGRQVGTGWNTYAEVLPGADNVVYGIKPDGEMRWYRHDGWADGSFRWTAGDGGKLVGTGWNTYPSVFAMGQFVYGITPGGEMHWYRHDGWADGSFAWTAGDGGRVVGSGWNTYARVLPGPGNVVYGITSTGEMHWYRHDGQPDGSSDWTAGDGGKIVGTGWDTYRSVRTVGNTFYGIKPDGEMRWYRHDGWADGSSNWTAGDGGRLVGTGWNTYRTVFGAFRRDVIG